MSVHVGFDISDAEYRVLMRFCVERGVTLPRLAQRLMTDLAEAVAAGRVQARPAPRRQRPPFTPSPAERARIIDMHNAGAPARVIAEQFRIGTPAVYRLIAELGLTPHPRGGAGKQRKGDLS